MKLAIIGCGGHGRVILDIARRCGHTVVGFLDDDPSKHGREIHGVKVLGSTPSIRDWPKRQTPRGVVVAIGDNHQRAELFARVRAWGFETPNLIHPQTVVASQVELTEGLVMMAGVVLNPGCRVGLNVCINTGARVDHDCVLHDHCHVFPGSILTGGVEVGEYSYIGSGAVINPYRKVGRDSYVGSGAVVIHDVPDGVVVAGVPAKVTRNHACGQGPPRTNPGVLTGSVGHEEDEH